MRFDQPILCATILVFLFESCSQNTQPIGLELVQEWGGRGTEPGQFHNPTSVAVGPNGFVYVTDSQNGRIQKFTGDAEFVKSWGDDLLDSPVGVATDHQGNV